MRLHASGDAVLVKALERSSGSRRSCRRTLEDIFQVVVMIGIQSAKLLRFLGALQLSFDIAVLRTVARFQPQAVIGPQLPLGTEPMERLHQCDQLSRPNRTDTRDLA